MSLLQEHWHVLLQSALLKIFYVVSDTSCIKRYSLLFSSDVVKLLLDFNGRARFFCSSTFTCMFL